MEKPKNLYVRPMDMNWGEGGKCWWERVCKEEVIKGEKNGTTVIA